MTSKNIWVVIPNWNGADMIGRCLRSLERQSLKANVVVVDNGSVDSSVRFIKSEFPEVKVLEFLDNAGFAGGVNRGIRYSLGKDAEYIALFNNDAEADRNWLKELVREMDRHEEAGIVACKILQKDKRHIDSTGEFYTAWGMPFPRGRNQPDNGQYDTDEEVFGASGGASLYRSKLFKQVGLFDEDYFAYFEDVDISFRAQLAGWKIRYTPAAVAYHGIGGTSSRMGDLARYHSVKNFLLLSARNLPAPLFANYRLLRMLMMLRMFMGSVLHIKFHVYIKGVLAALKLKGKTKVVRKQNLAHMKVHVGYIDDVIVHSRPPKIPRI